MRLHISSAHQVSLLGWSGSLKAWPYSGVAHSQTKHTYVFCILPRSFRDLSPCHFFGKEAVLVFEALKGCMHWQDSGFLEEVDLTILEHGLHDPRAFIAGDGAHKPVLSPCCMLLLLLSLSPYLHCLCLQKVRCPIQGHWQSGCVQLSIRGLWVDHLPSAGSVN